MIRPEDLPPASSSPADVGGAASAMPGQILAQLAGQIAGPAAVVAMLDQYAPLIEAFKLGAPADVVHHLDGLAAAVRRWAQTS